MSNQEFAKYLAQTRDPVSALNQYYASQAQSLEPPVDPIKNLDPSVGQNIDMPQDQASAPIGHKLNEGGLGSLLGSGLEASGGTMPQLNAGGLGDVLSQDKKQIFPNNYDPQNRYPGLQSFAAQRAAGRQPAPVAGRPVPIQMGYGGPNPLQSAYNMVHKSAKDLITGQEEHQKLYDDALNQEKEAAENKYKVEQQIQAEQQPLQKQFADAQYNAAVEQQKRMQAVQENIDKREKEIDQARANYLNSKIDPNGFWKDEKGETSLGKSIAGALIIGLGEFASRMPTQAGGGGKNTALEMINDAINKNIDAQKSNMEQKRIGYTMANDAYNIASQKYTKEQDRYNFAKIMMLDQTQAQLNEIANKYQGPMAKANHDMLNAQLELKKVELKDKLHQSDITNIHAAEALEINAASAVAQNQVAQGHLGIAQQELNLKKEATAQKEQPVAGTITTRRQSDKDREKVSEFMEQRDRALEIIEEIKEFRKGGGKMITGPMQQKKMQDLAYALAILRGVHPRAAMEAAKADPLSTRDPGEYFKFIGTGMDKLMQDEEDEINKITDSALRSKGARLQLGSEMFK